MYIYFKFFYKGHLCNYLFNPYLHQHAKLLQLCPTLCNPMDCSAPGSSVREISQVRILEWAARPSSKGSSWSRDQTHILCLLCEQVGSLPFALPEKPTSAWAHVYLFYSFELYFILLYHLFLQFKKKAGCSNFGHWELFSCWLLCWHAYPFRFLSTVFLAFVKRSRLILYFLCPSHRISHFFLEKSWPFDSRCMILCMITSMEYSEQIINVIFRTSHKYHI